MDGGQRVSEGAHSIGRLIWIYCGMVYRPPATTRVGDLANASSRRPPIRSAQRRRWLPCVSHTRGLALASVLNLEHARVRLIENVLWPSGFNVVGRKANKKRRRMDWQDRWDMDDADW
eukprot:jgi/Tetstr1/435841/TSEL_024729.t1